MLLPFDKIYCLHLAENQERYHHCLKEYKRLGIENKINFWWTCRHEISKKIGQFLTELHNEDYNRLDNLIDIYAGVFNCVFEHYSIIKTSYYRGFNNILILEDDLEFIDNIKLIENTFMNLPRDYDIIKFYDIEGDVNKDWYSNNESYIQKFIKVYNFGHSTAFYALSRRGMKLYCDLMDKKLVAADNIDISIYAYNNLIDAYRVYNRIAWCNNFKSDIIG